MPIHRQKRTEQASEGSDQEDLLKRLKVNRSQISAVTHVDYSARVQTVGQESAPRLESILKAFEAKTGVPVLINTSFNLRGEPIVCSPMDAECMMRSAIDHAPRKIFLYRDDNLIGQRLMMIGKNLSS